jgi:hypothetical protein
MELIKMKTSPWIVDGHCAIRVLNGSNSDQIKNRIAFIEKSPRIRLSSYTGDNDYENWAYGPKGSSGGNPEIDLTYGFDPISRQWCDEQLTAIGYTLG